MGVCSKKSSTFAAGFCVHQLGCSLLPPHCPIVQHRLPQRSVSCWAYCQHGRSRRRAWSDAGWCGLPPEDKLYPHLHPKPLASPHPHQQCYCPLSMWTYSDALPPSPSSPYLFCPPRTHPVPGNSFSTTLSRCSGSADLNSSDSPKILPLV